MKIIHHKILYVIMIQVKKIFLLFFKKIHFLTRMVPNFIKYLCLPKRSDDPLHSVENDSVHMV